MRTETPMVIDCETCPVRHVRCDDCMVTALGQTSSLPSASMVSLGTMVGLGHRPPGPEMPGEIDGYAAAGDEELPLDAAERRAVGLFVRAGLVAPQEAAGLTARRESNGRARAAG